MAGARVAESLKTMTRGDKLTLIGLANVVAMLIVPRFLPDMWGIVVFPVLLSGSWYFLGRGHESRKWDPKDKK